MTKEQLKTIADAIVILHNLQGGTKWEIEVGKPTYSPDDFVVYRPLSINGQLVDKLPTQVS